MIKCYSFFSIMQFKNIFAIVKIILFLEQFQIYSELKKVGPRVPVYSTASLSYYWQVVLVWYIYYN